MGGGRRVTVGRVAVAPFVWISHVSSSHLSTFVADPSS